MHRAGISTTALGILVAQAMLTILAVGLSVWGNLPWTATAGIGLVGMSGIAAESVRGKAGRLYGRAKGSAWLLTLAIPLSLAVFTQTYP